MPLFEIRGCFLTRSKGNIIILLRQRIGAVAAKVIYGGCSITYSLGVHEFKSLFIKPRAFYQNSSAFNFSTDTYRYLIEPALFLLADKVDAFVEDDRVTFPQDAHVAYRNKEHFGQQTQVNVFNRLCEEIGTHRQCAGQ